MVPLTQYILQSCYDLPQLKSEVYCQLMKQTSNPTNVTGEENVRNWQILAVTCCSFLPDTVYLRQLRNHLKRTLRLIAEGEVNKIAQFCLHAITKTRMRELPASTPEINAIRERRDIIIEVFFLGGRSIKVAINSFTTAGEITWRIKQQLGLERSGNGFGLFDLHDENERAVEDRTILADVLSKWERYGRDGNVPGKSASRLAFKIFTVLRTYKEVGTEVEQDFMFAQVHDQMIKGKYPCEDKMLATLGALRLQYELGDCKPGVAIDEQVKDLKGYYPVSMKGFDASESVGAGGLSGKSKSIRRTMSETFRRRLSLRPSGFNSQAGG
jgi:myosin X